MAHHGMPIAEYVYIEHLKETMDDHRGGRQDNVYAKFLDEPNAAARFHYVYGLLDASGWLPKRDGTTIKLSQAHRRWRRRLRKELKGIGARADMDNSVIDKSDDVAGVFRSRGNDEFKAKNDEESLCLYTRAVMIASVNSADYSLAVANRSAVLYHMHEYRLCVEDVDRALRTGMYPPASVHKLLERKANCYRQLGDVSLAVELYWKSLEALGEALMSATDRETIVTRISNSIEECQRPAEVNVVEKSQKISLHFTGRANCNVPALAESVEVVQLDDMGRGLVATRDIVPGEILIIEKPYAGICKNDEWKYNCDYCFKRCLAAIPCPKCTKVLYCGQTCLEKAYDTYHKVECSIVYPLKGDPTVESTHALAMRCFITLSNKLGIERYCSSVEQFESARSKGGGKFDERLLADEFYSIYTLNGNETTRAVENLFFIHCSASVMLSLLLLNENYRIPTGLIDTVGKSLVHLLCVTNLNSYVSMELPDHVKNEVQVPNVCMNLTTIALVLCPAYSLINHSCDPNVIVHTYNGVEVTRALQPVAKGSQLLTDYGSNFMLRSKEERNKHLLEQYQFQCRCQACVENWPMYLSMDSMSLSESQSLDRDMKCLPAEMLEKFHEITNKLLPHRKVKAQHMDFLFVFLNLLRLHVKKPCTMYYKCIEMIKQCLYYTSNEHIVDDKYTTK
ncbi:SET and MYND domain-containing protein 4-like [Adelges cooleyi]|uniref:SET and MYND domain-containing protein 4-like n=1 Tax=Adelges cooleyi TaxID=133065 RepID=UPI00217FBFCB|nr:SET and MYND domain-containing protein 4-like [Adelges cooleyi]XP_050427845.1 SET and MYND domain-containing protein 4-like [Adelges cooleyi]XP_050427846.1 SET and MYND domain-containing protein 4-like [Adelges cooleyi]XP_050427847.1 SET and MYND domain-containing protein 4-like [Adelges cooleyi]